MFPSAPFISSLPLLLCLVEASALAPRAQKANPLSLSSPANSTLPMQSPATVPSAAGSANPSLDLFNASQSSSGGNATQLTAAHVECATHGNPLNAGSCAQAIREMLMWLRSLPRQKVIVGERGRGFWDVQDPSFIMSSDGQCYLDIYLTDEEYDQTTVAELASAATMLLETCVQRPPGRGGIVRLLGKEQNIAIGVHPDPFGTQVRVQCMPPPPTGPPASSCRSLRDILPYSHESDYQTFGRPGSDADVVLPRRVYNDDGRCVLGLFTTGASDRSDPRTVQLAATALEAVCVRQGRWGKMTGLGRGHNLYVTLSDASQPMSAQMNSSGLDVQ